MRASKTQLIRFALVAFFTVGCSESVADKAARLPPLDGLSTVHLGMRAYALRRARPGAVAAPYYGFRETVGAVELMYQVPGSVQDGEAPPWWEPLESVVAMERFEHNPNIFALWQTAVRRAAMSIGARPTCYALRSPDREAWLVTWPRGSAELFVAAQTTTSSASVPNSGTIATGVARNGHGLDRAIFAPSTVRTCDGLIIH